MNVFRPVGTAEELIVAVALYRPYGTFNPGAAQSPSNELLGYSR